MKYPDLKLPYFPPFLVFVGAMILWESTVRLLGIPQYVLPAPSAVVTTVITARSTLLINLRTTFLESFLGFLLGSFVGLGLGIVLAESRLAARAFLPYIVGSNAVPVVAVAPIVVLWFGYGLLSKVVVSAFLCFFPLCINTYRGLSEAETTLKELFAVYGSTRWQFLVKGRFPNAAPFLFSGARLNATYAVIGAIVAEFIGSNSGLGFGMLHASYNLDVPRLWGYIGVAVVMGMAFYGVVWGAEYWHRSKRG